MIDRMATSQCGRVCSSLAGPRGRKTPPDALEKLTDPLMFAAAMVSAGKADVCIGNIFFHWKRARAGLRIIGLQPGRANLFYFPDVATVQRPGVGLCRSRSAVPQPTAAQLADIALASAETWRAITGEEPGAWRCCRFPAMVAPLPPGVANVQQATEIVRERSKLVVDGELQFDTPLLQVARVKRLPAREGKANVMVFPSLEAGNIGYKIRYDSADIVPSGH